MGSVTSDRRQGLNSSAAFKVACWVATTENITLSDEQTIDGVSVVTGNRVLVKNQTSGVDNGIYVVDTGAWTRDFDFDSSHDVVSGTMVAVLLGTENNGTIWYLSTTGSITIGTTSLTFLQWANIAGISALLAAFLSNPSSANLQAAVTDESGTGTLVFAISPTLTTPNLTTPTISGSPAFSEISNTGTTGAQTINWTDGANQKQSEPTGAITYTFTAPAQPCHLQLRIISDGTSAAYTHVWPASVKWLGETWAALANKNAMINFWYDGTNYWAIGVNQA